MGGKGSGGARSSAGRPRVQTIKVPIKPDMKWLISGVSEKFWREFCETASEVISPLGDELQESDYERFAEIVLVEGMDRFVKSKKRRDKKKGKQNE